MITPALIAEEVKTRTYSQVAEKYGVSRGCVAGIAYRARVRRPAPSRRPTPVPPPQEPYVQRAVLGLMGDGKVRTTPEIAARTGYKVNSVFDALRTLERGGAIRLLSRGRGGLPSIWQESPE